MSDQFIEVQLTAEARALMKKLEASMSAQAFFRAVFKLFERLASRAAAEVVRTQLSGNNLHRRTGQLAKSVVGRAEMVHGVPAIRVGVLRGPASKYAGMMEHGTRPMNPDSPYPTIVPKHARALAMPVDEALTPAGVDRYGGPRAYPGVLRFVPYPHGTRAVGALYDAESLKAAKGDLWKARRMYVLLKSLDLKPHWFLRNGMRAFLPMVLTEMTKYMRVALVIAG